jgi:hypothetical protein
MNLRLTEQVLYRLREAVNFSDSSGQEDSLVSCVCFLCHWFLIGISPVAAHYNPSNLVTHHSAFEERRRNNSIKFNSLLLVCCINSQKATDAAQGKKNNKYNKVTKIRL